jgi:hypothetical protein
MVIPGYSGPGEYGGYGRHYYFWHLPTGQFSIASSGYSGGKACDDGDSSFEPFDILRNVGDVFALRVLVPSNAPVVVLAGARGAVAINPKELTYWGVDLATGKPRPLKPGISACTAEELR